MELRLLVTYSKPFWRGISHKVYPSSIFCVRVVPGYSAGQVSTDLLELEPAPVVCDRSAGHLVSAITADKLRISMHSGEAIKDAYQFIVGDWALAFIS